MKNNYEFILSLDIGGANTKLSLLFLDFGKYLEETEEEDRHFYKSILASYENIYFSTIYFPFWMKQKKDFISVLKKIKKSKSKVPMTIGNIQITLFDNVIKGSFPKKKFFNYTIDVVNGDDETMEVISGKLKEVITKDQIDIIEQIMDEVRLQAEEEVLP